MIWIEGSCSKNVIFDRKGLDVSMKKYFIFQPSEEGSFHGEWGQCLSGIIDTAKNTLRPVKLNVFISVSETPEYISIRQEVLKSVIDTFGGRAPAVSVTVHPPQRPWKVIVEALFLASPPGEAVTKYFKSMPYVVINTAWGKEVWGAGLGSGYFHDDIRKASENSFDQAVALLSEEGMALDNIIRQWNYIGNILEIRNGFQHYQVFNEVRSEYYARHRSVTGYPAATGIGMKAESVIIDFCAVQPEGSVNIKGLSNPNQVNAYEYRQNVLKGVKDSGKSMKQPPQFERALIMASGGKAVLYVSGTASIIGQATIGKNDVSEQTLVTLENIKKLTDAERISQVLPESAGHSLKFSLLRVYVKSQDDFAKVRRVCEEHFPDVPAVFIEADVCRKDLLTEIEAEVQISY
jgi:enamine deaminase RidA (YjgF/YER057c/UK114 family)